MDFGEFIIDFYKKQNEKIVKKILQKRGIKYNKVVLTINENNVIIQVDGKVIKMNKKDFYQEGIEDEMEE